ncbi:MAG: hypothetical protein L6R48_01070 [Planctomycetes bacterium]|nr:hypothetical protein [Planctomycetota bacterium]
MTSVHLLACHLFAASTAAAVTIDDFEASRLGLRGHGADGMKSEVSLVSAPDGRKGTALRLSWPNRQVIYADCSYLSQVPMTMFDAGVAGEARAWLYLGPDAQVEQFAIRLRDANEEVFQWRVKVPRGQGWREVVIPLNAAKPDGSWGPSGKVDKVIDLPVRLHGYAVTFSATDSPAGEIFIDDVSVAK